MSIPGYTLETIDQFVGTELGVSDWMTLDQQRIDKFADVTGDHQWIHVDVQRAARESPTGGTIAHGFLALSALAGMAIDVGAVPSDAGRALNYGVDHARFLTPATSGSRIRARIALAAAEPKPDGRTLLRISCTMEIEDQPKPAVVADLLSMIVPA